MFYSVALQEMFKLAADKPSAIVCDNHLELSEECPRDLNDGSGDRCADPL